MSRLTREVSDFERRLAPEPAAVPEARHQVGQWLDATGVDADKGRDVMTVTSELVTSGVLHGGRCHIDVRAWAIANDVYVEVVTVHHAINEPAASAFEDPDADLLSLGILAQLTDGMAVKEHGRQSGVLCRFDLQGSGTSA
jgi:anti-sigma regulatory factor (Ser/Thr protein kinase)